MIVALPNAWHADRTGERFLHYVAPAIICMVGYIISATTTTTAPRYFSMFLMTGQYFSSTLRRFPEIFDTDVCSFTVGFASGFVILAWISNTIPRPAAKKAAAIAMVNAMGNIGSIPGSYIWPAKYGPFYVQSFAAEIALIGFACICAFGLRFYLRAQNKTLDREEAMRASAEGGSEKLGDGEDAAQVKGFRYLY